MIKFKGLVTIKTGKIEIIIGDQSIQRKRINSQVLIQIRIRKSTSEKFQENQCVPSEYTVEEKGWGQTTNRAEKGWG